MTWKCAIEDAGRADSKRCKKQCLSCKLFYPETREDVFMDLLKSRKGPAAEKWRARWHNARP